MNDSSSTSYTENPTGSDGPSDAALALKSSVIAGAHDLTDQAKHITSDVVSQARKSATSKITGGKERAADTLGNVAEALRHTGDRLSTDDESTLTEYVSRAADKVEAASDYLREQSIADLADDVGKFARREPALFLGGAFVLGLIGGRFLKSSRPLLPSSRGGAGSDVASNGGNGGGAGSSRATQQPQRSKQKQPGPVYSPGSPAQRRDHASAQTKPELGVRPLGSSVTSSDSTSDGNGAGATASGTG